MKCHGVPEWICQAIDRSKTYGTLVPTRPHVTPHIKYVPEAAQTSVPRYVREMTTVDDLWYLADEASQQAEQTYHRLTTDHDGLSEFETTTHVSRRRFRVVAERIRDNGAPYGAHTVAYLPAEELLLVRHEGVNMWVLPGGETHDGEDFRDGAERELMEEAGLGADYEGLELLGRVTIRCGDHTAWGVLPIFAARAEPGTPEVRDPDDEISSASWFEDLPADTRDRAILVEWYETRFGGTD